MGRIEFHFFPILKKIPSVTYYSTIEKQWR